ncbi:40S ribosomal protein S8-B [[Candida] jaroonii]|uniref:40S ribosomal protein S8-B n=1 Tax=[Candida] jaroonii TaxID=467808 RepID=A0ACA9Y493_9ASCO|nr:40S ribosomal protein S8-B [[Candida] jaroonii]
MGISRDSRHKRAATGAKRAQFRKKRKFELGRQASSTRLGPKRIHSVRTRGGNQKFRAIRIEGGNFSWASEGVSRKTRIARVVYHPSNNELVRTNTLTKAAIVQVDATPFRQWYENHYGQTLGKKSKDEEKVSKSRKVERKLASRASSANVETGVDSQFGSGRLLAAISSRPGQSGRCDGYILEGEELAFYQRRMTAKK